ncbi:hypothetical protein GCM10010249_47140 [Streptomyces roseolilacinus]|uniref:Uncharacterized protein n=1 Tax=Streptomyces roseolilacinus TaxID=66904 RepID=A0A918B3Z2_9ACTN|nr:hypothetical protein GCM10010249_47140 [Streptomyces roseolilacinus]
MGVAAVGDVLARLALVPVPGVLAVQVPVVGVVDVVAVDHGLVAAGGAVYVGVRLVFLMQDRHGGASVRRVADTPRLSLFA